MITGVPKPLQCSRWSWSAAGARYLHIRCQNLAAVRSEVPGRILLHTCVDCHQKRAKETA